METTTATPLDALRDAPPANLPVTVNNVTSDALVAQARAAVEARYIMALRTPRNWEQVRQDLLRECQIPGFANHKSVWYVKPRAGSGKDEGFGIRFVEAAIRCMRNILVEQTTLHEDDQRELFRVTVTDVETNNTYPSDVRLVKTVERSRPMDDGSYISVRTNSQNKKTYTVPATEEDLYTKRGALVSKAIRTVGLRLIPFWLLEEAKATIMQTRANDAAQDPDAAIKKLIDSFFMIGVSANQIADYLGHPVTNANPSEIVNLRNIYAAVSTGDMTWTEVMEDAPIPERPKRAKPQPQAQPEPAPATEPEPPKQQRQEPKPFDLPGQKIGEPKPDHVVDTETGEILDDRTNDMFGGPPPDLDYDPGETMAQPPQQTEPAPQQRRRRASAGLE